MTAAGSPAIGGAVGGYPAITTDMDGQARNDGAKDVGADELSGAPITNPPLTPGEVGPNWLASAPGELSSVEYWIQY